MPYNLVVQVSRTGTADPDFTTLTTVPNQQPGQAFTVSDAPVPPGQLRFYRARFECATDPSVVSDWSAVLFARGPYPVVQGDPATMADIRTSGVTALAISNPENAPGHACRAEYYLPFISHTLRSERQVTEDPSNDGGIEDLRELGAGVVRVAGSVTTNFTPGGGFLRLLGAFYNLQAGDVTDIAANGPAQAHHQQLWKPSAKCRPVTLHSKEGDNDLIYSGLYGNQLSYRVSKTQNTPVQLGVDLMGLSHWIMPSVTEADLAALGLGTAGYTTVDPLGPVDWVLTLGGRVLNCNEHGVTFNRNLQMGDVGNNFMAAAFLYPNKARTSVTATVYWSSLEELQQFYGITVNRQDFGVWKAIGKLPLSILYTPQLNLGGYRNETELIAPRVAIRSLVKDVPENGAIMQQLELQPLKDSTQGMVAHWWRTKNDETFATLTRNGWEIAYLPKQEAFPWWALGGKAAAGATSTVIAAQPGPNFSAVDGAYVGKTLRLLLPPSSTSPLKGLERTVVGYTGSSRTFTLDSALPAAPATDTEFLVALIEPTA